MKIIVIIYLKTSYVDRPTKGGKGGGVELLNSIKLKSSNILILSVEPLEWARVASNMLWIVARPIAMRTIAHSVTKCGIDW